MSSEQQSNKKTKVVISVYAARLKNVAGLGKGTSDPFAICTLLAGGPQEQPRVLGKTEVIKNSLSPAWTTTFTADYTFGKETKFNIGIFDKIRKGDTQKSMGSAVFEIGEVLGSRGNIKAKKLRNGGTCFVRVTEAARVNYGVLRLKLQGAKLKNVDGIFSKSDPFFVLNSQTNDAGGRTWHPVYRSEVVKNNLNPTWKEIVVSVEKLCDGDKSRPIQIEVWDWEKSGKHQAMGKCETTVGALVGAQSIGSAGGAIAGGLELKHKGKSYGKLVVAHAEISGEDLTPKSHAATAGEIAAMSASPSARPIPGTNQSNGNDLPAFSQALDHPEPSKQQHSAAPPVPIPPPVSRPKFDQNNRPRFVNYLEGGCEINLGVAIDFTGSNGDPRKPGTLHYMHPDGQMNDYEKALTAIGSIVARYDSDQKFPVWGFGAKYGGVVQHCFQVGGSDELKGVGGILEGYRNTFKTGLIMSGPTVFAEVIQFAASQAQSKQEANHRIGKQSYTILLILTDGAVTDIESTKQAIRYASSAPLSIVIVGVGNADFSAMQFLDDFQRDEGGRTRDIVQFVEFNRHRHSRESLTRETLDEIPDQLVGYFVSNNIMPLPPISGSKLSIFEEDYNAEQDIDLSYDENEEGEISLMNASGAHFDGQSYGNVSTFLPPPIPPPAAQGGPPHGAPQPYQPQASMRMSQSYGAPPPQPYGAPPHQPYGAPPPQPYGAPPPQPYGAPPPQPYGAPPHGYPQAGQPHQGVPMAAPVTVPTMIHIQAPPNSYPGMQLQVQNPSTGQFQIVTIPDGVPAGAMFAVNL